MISNISVCTSYLIFVYSHEYFTYFIYVSGTYFCIDISYLMWHKIEVKMFSKHTLFLLIPVDQLWTGKFKKLLHKRTKEGKWFQKSGAGTDDVYKKFMESLQDTRCISQNPSGTTKVNNKYGNYTNEYQIAFHRQGTCPSVLKYSHNSSPIYLASNVDLLPPCWSILARILPFPAFCLHSASTTVPLISRSINSGGV